jgi:proteasome alpha subunit
MITPYDWQEGIGHRAQYIEAKLAHGAPVIGLSLAEGILLATYRRQTRKIFEIYDRIAFAAVGQASDIEAVRVAALDFASREGYQRSEADVTIQRVVSSMSQPVKRAFGDFGQTPLVIRGLFAEVNAAPDDDIYYTLDFNGDYAVSKNAVAVAGTDEIARKIEEGLKDLDKSGPAEALLPKVWELWKSATLDPDTSEEEALEGLFPEALLLERSNSREDRFHPLTPLP